jgi:hypothetical protein
VVDRWEHSRRCSTLWRGNDNVGVTWPAWQAPGWVAYSDLPGSPRWGLLGTFATRAAAMRAVAAACDPKKHPLPLTCP